MTVSVAATSILQGYAADAERLVPRFEALATTKVLASVADLLPTSPIRMLDVGAGSGRDAAWFSRRGHKVTAVEPVDELRHAGTRLHSDLDILWFNDQLPVLSSIAAACEPFELILLIGVWQHLSAEEQTRSMQTLSSLLAPSGRLIISVRHGPGAPSRPCFPADISLMMRHAKELGLTLVRQRRAPSVQDENRRAGVEWTWLVWERSDPERQKGRKRQAPDPSIS